MTAIPGKCHTNLSSRTDVRKVSYLPQDLLEPRPLNWLAHAALFAPGTLPACSVLLATKRSTSAASDWERLAHTVSSFLSWSGPSSQLLINPRGQSTQKHMQEVTSKASILGDDYIYYLYKETTIDRQQYGHGNHVRINFDDAGSTSRRLSLINDDG